MLNVAVWVVSQLVFVDTHRGLLVVDLDFALLL
jgi:hypothetical protein